MHFCMNLFVKNVYVGHLKVPFILQQKRESDDVLAQYMGRYIEKAFQKHSRILGRRADDLNNVVQALINGVPIEATSRRGLDVDSMGGHFICIKINPSHRTQQKVPIEYICNHIDSTFHGCITLEHDSSIVTFIDLAKSSYSEKNILDTLAKILQMMDLKGGNGGTSGTDYVNYLLNEMIQAGEISHETADGVIFSVFNTAGKMMFADFYAEKGLRDWLGVPGDVKDGRALGGYIEVIQKG